MDSSSIRSMNCSLAISWGSSSSICSAQSLADASRSSAAYSRTRLSQPAASASRALAFITQSARFSSWSNTKEISAPSQSSSVSNQST